MVLMPAQTRCKKNANIANVEPRGKMKGNLFLKGNATKCQQSCVDEKLCRFAVLTKSGKCTAYTSCAGTARRFINFKKSDDKIKRMADDTKCVKKANIADIGNGVHRRRATLVSMFAGPRARLVLRRRARLFLRASLQLTT